MASTAWTVEKIRARKGRRRIAALTAYDYPTARLLDACGLPLILVGDSLAMTALGHETTLPATMDSMIDHAAAVVRGVKDALVVADMPFMSYQASTEQAMVNAGRLLKEAGVQAVKLEGGTIRQPVIEALVANGIPVMGHVGMLPQSVRAAGYKVQGKDPEAAARLLADARALETAGAFAVVLECVPADVARDVTEAVGIPTIGIGAGPHCDGQILVVDDLLGIGDHTPPRFVKQYAQLGEAMRAAFTAYRDDVDQGVFPADEHGY